MQAEEMQTQMRDHTWYPFTQMQEFLDKSPLCIVSAQDNWLYDADNNKYLDAVSSLWTNLHGHNHPDLNQAITAQLQRAAHTTLLGLTHPTAQKLSGELIKLVPDSLQHVFYSDSGATAVEIALKMAFQYMQLTGRKKKTNFLHLSESYHGDTLGAVAVGGINLFHQVYGSLLLKTFSIPTPHSFRHPEWKGNKEEFLADRVAEAEALIKKHAAECCALIVEPLIQGAAGMLVQPEGYLRALRELTHKYELLLIVDEVATGFGRTGKMFACEHEDVLPDLLCLGKGITGGYLPLAATLSTTEIFKAFLGKYNEYKTFFHGHTYTGNPLGCAAALASLQIFQKEKVLENLQPKLERYCEGMQMLSQLKNVGDVRYRGLMGGVELQDAEGRSYPAAKRLGYQVILKARREHLMLRPLGDVIVILPPLSITLTELDLLFAGVKKSIIAVC